MTRTAQTETSTGPIVLLRVLLAAIALAMTVCIAVVVLSFATLETRSSQAGTKAATALLSANSRAELSGLVTVMQDRSSRYLLSEEVMLLPESQQIALANLLNNEWNGIGAASVSGPLIPLEMSETVEFESGVTTLRSNLGSLLESDTDEASRLEAATLGDEAFSLLAAYYADPTPANFAAVQGLLLSLGEFTDDRATILGADADVLHDEVQDIIILAGLILLLAVATAGITIFYISHKLGITLRQTITSNIREQTELAATTSRLSFRNEQLNALHSVFSEITDTLSLESVVSSTLRESMKIMRADMATLRILRGNELVPAGSMASTGQEIEGLRPIQLGVGPTGKTAKRGRTLRIDEGGEQIMVGLPGSTLPGNHPSEQTKRAPMESGIIVPLVVGAKVVGTLACWARNENAFNDEDQRILEMMASQVATAIAAADATESSERRAHLDPLTSLSNRRQMDEDLAGELAELADQGGNAVVAMLDIDNFKLLNDHYGHHVGDVALQRIAAVLRSSVRENDHVYRFGGEEFVVVFSDTTVEEATRLAERLRASVKAVKLTGEDGQAVAPTTVSIGLSLMPAHGTDVRLLIDLADKAMYKSKDQRPRSHRSLVRIRLDRG